MRIIKEFKKFAIAGNAMDMAVGIIIASAFAKIVSSLIADIIMPPIGMLLGGVDFSNLVIILKHATDSTPAVTINYGTFINKIIDFTVVALCVFIVIKEINRLRGGKKTKKEEAFEEEDMSNIDDKSGAVSSSI